jgi:monofunctional glycosyltransferase
MIPEDLNPLISMETGKLPPKLVKIAHATGIVAYMTIRTLWLIVWTLYQVALGAVLILLVWGFFRVQEYFSFQDIHGLVHENPTSTTFIDAQRTRLSDSLRTHGVYPAPDSLIKWKWVGLDSIPKLIQEVALVAEDAKFFEHQGFDLEQIEFAVVANHQSGKQARGASTITQQVAKNLYLSRDKELSRKLREAIITLELEYFLPKERILEIYLNIAQFDQNVFGIRAASQHYFKKEPIQLTPDEAINLVCLLPAPTSWNLKRPNNAYLQHKRLVFRNYTLYKGMKKLSDSTDYAWQDSVFSNLAEQLSEERWKGLRTRNAVDDSNSDTASTSTPTQPPRTF